MGHCMLAEGVSAHDWHAQKQDANSLVEPGQRGSHNPH